jgi:N-glycosylase/DNA lyase
MDKEIMIDVCKREEANNMAYYFRILTYKGYDLVGNDNKKILRNFHKHLRKCRVCKSGYKSLKSRIASNEVYVGKFSGKDFARLRANERRLDDLVGE